MKLKDLLLEVRLFQNSFIKIDIVEAELNKIFSQSDKKPEIEFDKNFPIVMSSDLFSPDLKLSRIHYHECLEIGYCYEGSGIFLIDNETISFAENSVSIIFPGQYHQAVSSATTNSKWRFIFLDIARLFSENAVAILPVINKLLSCSSPNAILINNQSNPTLTSLIKLMIDELLEKRAEYKFIVKDYLSIILRKIYGEFNFNKDSEVAFSRRQLQKVIPALEYISKNYTEDITIAKLASICSLSEMDFRRSFTEFHNLPPIEYTNKYRIQIACLLLKYTESSILNISYDVGFRSISSFNRQFKKFTGTTPSMFK